MTNAREDTGDVEHENLPHHGSTFTKGDRIHNGDSSPDQVIATLSATAVDPATRRVAYVWSPELEAVSNALPSNLGRSSIVHSLIQRLGYLKPPAILHGPDVMEDQEGERNSVDAQSGREAGHGQAEVVAPIIGLGSRERLVRYHSEGYIDFVLGLGDKTSSMYGKRDTSKSQNRDDDDGDSDSKFDSDGSFSLNDRSSGPVRKRRKHVHRNHRNTQGESRLARHEKQLKLYGLEHDCPPFASLPEYISTVASSTLTAIFLLTRPISPFDIAINWDGGRHHAHKGKASGFCYVADIQLGILALIKEGVPFQVQPPLGDIGVASPANIEDKSQQAAVPDNMSADLSLCGPSLPVRSHSKPRIMYLDLDLHYGDAVASAFRSPVSYSYPHPSSRAQPKAPQVLTLSIHHSSPLFFPPPSPSSLLPSPDTSSPFSLSLPLAAYPSPATYAAIWPSVEKVKDAFDPDYVVLQLGSDGLCGDRIGNWGNWATHGRGGMLWCAEKVRGWGRRMCILGGGGYDPCNTARAWAGVTGVMLGKDMPRDLDIPHHDHFPSYAPNFTIEVSPGHARDENTSEELLRIEQTFDVLARRIANIVQGPVRI